MRSVLITDREYRQGELHQTLRPDELLQMFGRAGRRGFDEKGYILTTPEKPSLREGRPLRITGQNQIDWPSFLFHFRTSQGSKAGGRTNTQRFNSLFILRANHSHWHEKFSSAQQEGEKALRPQKVHKGKSKESAQEVWEILNSEGLWERKKGPSSVNASEAYYYKENKYFPTLAIPNLLQKLKIGNLCKFKISNQLIYGRELPVAKFPEEKNSDSVILTKSFYQELKKHKLLPKNKLIVGKKCPYSVFEKKILKQIPKMTHGAKIHELQEKGNIIYAKLDFSDSIVYGVRDQARKF